MATNNPSWTERVDTGYNDTTRDSSLAVFTATRTEDTATGDFTVTYSATEADRETVIVYALAPQVNGSFNAPDTKINAYAFTPIQSIQIDAIVDEPTTSMREMTDWQNESKPTTDWQNDPL
jgi:hypothetical protein